MMKHAYLIMAHNQPELLKTLLTLIDDERNDIYVHVDKKMKNFEEADYEKILKKSKIYWIKRNNVRWGEYSQIKCELQLLKVAVKYEHNYYHLLSGVDLPLKKQNDIHDFFKKYGGLEFIDEDSHEIREDLLERIRIYHFGGLNKSIAKISRKIQKLININRIKKYDKVCFQKGRNWFSITHDLALYLINNEKRIKRMFGFSECGDEMFLQTLAENSIFKERICNRITMPDIPDTRHIDWQRGTPYVFRKNDYIELKNSTALFARKFDYELDSNIVDLISYDLLNNTTD